MSLTDEQLDEALEGFVAQLTPVVQTELDRVAAEFADQVQDATELVATAYSVSSIRRLWNARIPRIMTSLRDVFRRSARLTADGEGVPTPTPAELEGAYTTYAEAVGPLLETVGDNLSDAAQRSLAEGVNAGEDIDQLKARLIAVFDDTGAQLGPVRANRIAQTEGARAFNAGTLAAANIITGPTRPLVKQWVTRHDTNVRQAHRDVDGQLQLLADPFDVGGFAMQYPGDPSAPMDLTINCRCVLKATAPRERTASVDELTAADDGELESKMPPQLKAYWLAGEGAAKVRWGTPGSFDRCVRELKDDFPQDPEGLCANLYKEATGRWPGEAKTSGETVHTGAMVALMPSAEDAARLGKLSAEAEDQLHLTLFYLGDAESWGDDARNELIRQIERATGWLAPVKANAFGVSQWNPSSDSPAFVWNIGDTDPDPQHPFQLRDVQLEIQFALEDRDGESPDIPRQHSPWAPHVCAAYGEADVVSLTEGCGPITFDRIRIGFGGEYTDFELAPYGEPVSDVTADSLSMLTTLPWSTPGATALAYENQQTGDGRVFSPGALYWDGPGPWPLMANENFDGHDDASLAGAIEWMDREGDRLAGTGVLYLNQEAGYEAAVLLAQDAPLGVSVDLDDVDIEMVDATDNELAYRTRLLRASLLPTPDGGFFLKGEMPIGMTAGTTATVTESLRVVFTVGPDGAVPRAAFELEAAAGDPDATEGAVIDRQQSGDYLMRITRARVRGATLVTIPAYVGARITLDEPSLSAAIHIVAEQAPVTEQQSAVWATRNDMGEPTNTDYARVLRHVRRSKTPVGPAKVAQSLKIPIVAAKRLLAEAARKGEIVKLTRGLYTDRTKGAVADPVTPVEGVVTPGDQVASATGIDAHVNEEADGDEMDDLQASAWSVMADLPAMPAAWFREPTAAELPAGGAGVNYANGRIFGWVAQANEPHAGYAKRIVINDLGRIDTTHFLRQRFTLDDGSSVKAGAFTMNAGHHRDGAECETSACQFDDTRTVAGIVTVGMNERGMWFSGAAAPWLSEWDRSVFMATQPSYHLKQSPKGGWQLRAVLAVPVPGHSSPLLASAVVERSQLALTAAATMAEVDRVVEAETAREAADQLVADAQADGFYPQPAIDYDRLADSMVAALARAEERRKAESAELEALLTEARKMGLDTTEGM
jgi:2'-5' RNA ligase